MADYGYGACLRCGWTTGVHDCRGLNYQHPWVVIHRPSGAAVGCWTKKEALDVLRRLKAGEYAA